MPYDLYSVRLGAATCWSRVGMPFPFLIAPHSTKGFGPVWGIALSTLLRLLIGSWHSPSELASALCVAPRHHPCRRSAAVSPPKKNTDQHGRPMTGCLHRAT